MSSHFRTLHAQGRFCVVANDLCASQFFEKIGNSEWGSVLRVKFIFYHKVHKELKDLRLKRFLIFVFFVLFVVKYFECA